MAGIAVAGTISPLLDIVWSGTPVVWQCVKVLLLDTDCRKGVPHGRYDPQGCHFAGALILADDHSWLGLCPFAIVAAVTVIVWCRAVAGGTGKLIAVLIMAVMGLGG